ncbi:MAG: hypothetical protein JWQ98_1317 [Chlorobi bacterium]|nr:hypothetical protein [Chlorobiota bacterium]
MNARLTIGVVSPGPGWRIILGQLGVAWERISRWDAVTPGQYSAILVNAPLDDDQIGSIDRYIRDGGAVLDAGHFLPRIDRGAFTRASIGSIAPASGDDIFRDVWLADIHATVLRHNAAGHMGGLVYLATFGDGRIAHVPLDADALMSDRRSGRKRFYLPGGNDPSEITARVSKGEIRKIIGIALRWLHTDRGLPYVHLHDFPGRLDSLFCYRIDSDYGTRGQIDELYRVARQHEMRLTWFLHVEAHREWLDRFNDFQEQEIGVHCFRHRTFGSYEENRANISEAMWHLKREGIPFDGFAAPNGFWNRPLQRAIDDLGFLYSSEFSLDYDNLPCHPPMPGGFASALQVPVHPVCIGSLLRVKASGGAMKSYFRWMIDRKLQTSEPAMLYHHPGHEHFEVMGDTFAHVRELGIPNMTLSAYARWWRARSAVRFNAQLTGDELSTTATGDLTGVAIAVERDAGSYGFPDIGRPSRLDDIAWIHRRGRGVAMPEDIGRVRRFSLLALRHAIEDYNSRVRQ